MAGLTKTGLILGRGPCSPALCSTRGMATLKDIRLRLRSVKNIQKITQSMKMISAAKYNKAERELRPARPYGEAAQKFYEAADVQHDEDKATRLIVAITSDRGLCGGINSSICKHIRNDLGRGTADVDKVKIVAIGDKARQIMGKEYGKHFIATFKDVGRKSATFSDAVEIYQAILDSGYDFGKGEVLYNHFRSVVSYRTSVKPFYSMDSVAKSEKIGVYDSVDADILKDYQDFQLTSLIYYTLKENATSEQSSRMSAMDNATKNAGEMIDKLTLTFNRTRQSVITRELIEIISGAAAL